MEIYFFMKAETESFVQMIFTYWSLAPVDVWTVIPAVKDLYGFLKWGQF